MALEDIIKKIENEAEGKAKEIEEETEKIIFNLKEEGSRQLTQKKKEILDSAEKAKKRVVEKARFSIHHEINDKITEKKLKAVDDVYVNVINELKNLSKDDYFKLLESFLDNFLKKTDYQVIVAENRQAETREFFTNKGLNVVGTINSQGGFIIKDKEIEVNNTFEAIINKLRKETEIEVVKILFN